MVVIILMVVIVAMVAKDNIVGVFVCFCCCFIKSSGMCKDLYPLLSLPIYLRYVPRTALNGFDNEYNYK